jgi:hypothetical protein
MTICHPVTVAFGLHIVQNPSPGDVELQRSHMARKRTASKSLTGAQRQAAYRERMRDNFDVARLDIKVPVTVPGYLARLAAHHSMSPGDVLKKLLMDAEHKALKGMKPTQEAAYYAVRD